MDLHKCGTYSPFEIIEMSERVKYLPYFEFNLNFTILTIDANQMLIVIRV